MKARFLDLRVFIEQIIFDYILKKIQAYLDYIWRYVDYILRIYLTIFKHIFIEQIIYVCIILPRSMFTLTLGFGFV